MNDAILYLYNIFDCLELKAVHLLLNDKERTQSFSFGEII